jgi:formylglycine-generating enzyme required for sulfatase activity
MKYQLFFLAFFLQLSSLFAIEEMLVCVRWADERPRINSNISVSLTDGKILKRFTDDSGCAQLLIKDYQEIKSIQVDYELYLHPPGHKNQSFQQGNKYTFRSSQRIVLNSKGMEFVEIPASVTGKNSKLKPFFISTTEITQRQWQQIMQTPPLCKFSDPDRPVESVTWKDVQNFITTLNKNSELHEYRLPTEAEWELVAGCGVSTPWFFGETPLTLADYACFQGHRQVKQIPDNTEFGTFRQIINIASGSGGKSCKVKSFKPNFLGLYDVLGNVWEYVTYEGKPAYLPSGFRSSQIKRVKGGGWNSLADNLKTKAFDEQPAYLHAAHTGFRLVMTFK